MTSVPSPIKEKNDIYRGGWVNAVGLSPEPTDGTGRNFFTESIGHKMEVIDDGSHKKDFVPRQRALLRVRHVLDMIGDAFPEQEAIVLLALNFIHPFFHGGQLDIGDDLTGEIPQHKKLAIGLPAIRSYGPSVRMRHVRESKLFSEAETFEYALFGRNLPAQTWSWVMQISNRFGPLTSDEAAFLSPILLPVLQAAGRGIFIVLCDQNKNYHLHDIPELDRQRYIYAYHCKHDEDGQYHCDDD